MERALLMLLIACMMVVVKIMPTTLFAVTSGSIDEPLAPPVLCSRSITTKRTMLVRMMPVFDIYSASIFNTYAATVMATDVLILPNVLWAMPPMVDIFANLWYKTVHTQIFKADKATGVY